MEINWRKVKLKRKDPAKSFADTQTWFAAAGLTWQDELAKYFLPESSNNHLFPANHSIHGGS